MRLEVFRRLEWVVGHLGKRTAIAWVAAGGLAYTVGVVFFVWDRLKFNHAIWHLFVMAGTVCHYLAVIWYGHSAI